MYYLVYGLLYGISLLPTRLLYGISDGLAFLLYTVIRYRRGIVMRNLRDAFPEKRMIVYAEYAYGLLVSHVYRSLPWTPAVLGCRRPSFGLL